MQIKIKFLLIIEEKRGGFDVPVHTLLHTTNFPYIFLTYPFLYFSSIQRGLHRVDKR